MTTHVLERAGQTNDNGEARASAQSIALGAAVAALDTLGLGSLAAHVARWPSLGAYLHARDRVQWFLEHSDDDALQVDCAAALRAIERAMSLEVCS